MSESTPSDPPEANTRLILDAITFGVAVVGRDGIIVAANRAWERVVDTTGPNLSAARIGGNYMALLRRLAEVGNAFAIAALAAMEAVMGGERRVASHEYELRVNGVLRWFRAKVTPLGEAGGGVVVTHHDITPRVMSTLALQGANEQLRKLSERLIAVEQEERRAIALDLHDDVGQALVSAAIGLHRLEDLAGAEYQELLRQCSRIVGESVDKLRALAGELRPVELDNGLQPALEALVANARATTGATIELKLCRIENARPYRAVELVCYRVIQEALNNAIRHARASEIAVRVECDERLIKLNVRDNGAGFAASGPQRSGVGLGGMSERARLVGGQLKVLSVPGSGTSVTGIFPLGPPQSP